MDRKTQRNMELRHVTIKDVDPTLRKITVIDNFGTVLFVSQHILEPLVAVPVVGEVWVVERNGVDWFLKYRQDKDTDKKSITDLAPGDRLITTSGNIYLDANEIYFNGHKLSDILTALGITP